MKIVNRICKEDYRITDSKDESKVLHLKKGKSYTTSLVNEAPKCGPDPKLDCVTVFSTYWATVPLSIFELEGKEGAVANIKQQPYF
jgi:hypothetical protein